jgi:asparagine synthase (glutamine-hydrolysing)
LVEPGVGLVNARLAVVDIPGGDQPIWNERRTVGCVFNGEIYNFSELRDLLSRRGHRLSTTCDTEVLVHLYEDVGASLVDDIHGMFSFAIYDALKEQVLIGRDRLGIKPLYLAHLSDGIAFASSIRSLLDLGVSKDPDISAIAEYLRFYKVGEPRTSYLAIRTLLPGNTMTVDVRSMQTRQNSFFSVGDLKVAVDTTGAEAEARDALSAAVRSHLVADVEVGAFLSGGIDSSLVVAEAQKASTRPLRTFSIAFAGTGAFNEAPWAERVAHHLGTQHQTIEIESAPLELLHESLDACHQPFAIASVLPLLLLSKAASAHLKVVLTGDGGDEVGFGYPWYRWMDRTSRRFVRDHRNAALALEWAERLATRGASNRLRRAAKFARGFVLGGPDASDAWRYDVTCKGAIRLLSPEARPDTRADASQSPTARAWSSDFKPVDALRRADLSVLLRDEMLTKVDRATMAAGIEARVPLLDDSFVAAMVAVPTSQHLAHQGGKALQRKWLSETVPGLDFNRPKRGFDVPIQQWLRGDLRSEVDRLLLAPGRSRLIDRDAARAVWSRAEGGAPGAGHTVFAMLLAEIWWDREGISR